MALFVAILCAAACSNHGPRSLDPKRPDRILFDKAMKAVQEKRFTLANITLQTLVNTYPDSNYADQARLMLKDPQVARCSEGFSSTPNLCEPERH
jgi:outer membrane protein assembly factor BamD (BamD/ComL family)